MKTISNDKMSEYTTQHKTFKNTTGSVYANSNVGTDLDLYIVYSYGEHFPMYVYDHHVEMWFGNSDSNSRTTNRHLTLARPDTDHINMLPTEALTDLIYSGGYHAYCVDRCGTLYYTTSTASSILNQPSTC